MVIGGNGLIGAKNVERLRKKGHDVVAASPKSGVNAVTGKAWPRRSRARRSWSTWRIRRRSRTRPFWNSSRPPVATCSRRRKPPACATTSRCRSSGPSAFRAAVTSAPRWAQENLIKGGGIPYTIVQSTQFFEFMGAIAQSGTVKQTVRLPPAYMQPIASDDVADAMADVALAAPVNGTIEIAGPERLRRSVRPN